MRVGVSDERYHRDRQLTKISQGQAAQCVYMCFCVCVSVCVCLSVLHDLLSEMFSLRQPLAALTDVFATVAVH